MIGRGLMILALVVAMANGGYVLAETSVFPPSGAPTATATVTVTPTPTPTVTSTP